MLVTGELWPSQRLTADEDPTASLQGEVAMESVEHLGQYVFDMTKTRIQQLQDEQGGSAMEESMPEATEEEEEEEGGQGTYFDEEGNQGDADVDVEPDIQEVREGEA